MDRPAAGGFLGLTAFQAEGCGLPLRGNAYEVSVTGLAFFVIWQNKHYVDQPPPVAFPPFGALRHHLPPAERWDNKVLKGSLLICGSTVSTGYKCPRLRGERWWRQPPKGGCISLARRAVGLFSNARRAVVKVLYKLAPFINLEAPSTTLSGIAAVKLKPLKNLRPSGPSTLTPHRGLSIKNPFHRLRGPPPP